MPPQPEGWQPHTATVFLRVPGLPEDAADHLWRLLQKSGFLSEPPSTVSGLSILALEDGITLTVGPAGIEVEQRFKAGGHEGASRFLHLVTLTVGALKDDKIREFHTMSRVLVPCADPFDLLAQRVYRDGLLDAGAKAKPGSARIRCEVDGADLRITLSPHSSTPSMRKPHLAVRSEFVFLRISKQDMLSRLANWPDYAERGQGIVMKILGTTPPETGP